MSFSKEQRMKKLEKMKDENIDYTDIPELDKDFWKKATIEYPEKKKPVTIRLDADVFEWFKSTGKGYQTRINAVLRSYYETHKQNVS